MKRFFLIFGLLAVGLPSASAQLRLTLDKAIDLALSELIQGHNTNSS